MRVPLKRIVAVCVVALMVGLSAMTAPVSAGDRPERPRPNRPLFGLDYSLQNYFDTDVADPSPDTLIPFFDNLTGRVRGGVEIDENYIYNIDFTARSIIMKWNRDPAFDFFEPFVGKAAGLTQEEAAAAGFADQYHITFDEPVSHLRLRVSRSANITPDVFFLDDYTVVISIPGGTTIGDGYRARVFFLPPR